MSEITLILGNERYMVDRQLLIEHSEFFKTLLETYPDKKELEIPFPIKSLHKFIRYINTKDISLDYDEFLVHKFLDTKSYFDALIYHLIRDGPNHKKIRSLNDDNLACEIYNRLPIDKIPQEILTSSFLESYRRRRYNIDESLVKIIRY